MMRFEIKKVFSKNVNKIALLTLLVILVIVSMLTVNRVEYTDGNGNSYAGIKAARNLREAKNEWAGYITEDVLGKVFIENREISNSKEAMSDDIQESNKAYARKQGLSDILDMIISAYSKWRDYDYYAVENISQKEAKDTYDQRISGLKEWLDSGEEAFSDQEKNYLVSQYEKLRTPFYYEYISGWSALLQNIPTFILIVALIIGVLTSGIFSDEFQLKADSIFFSSKLGRNKAVRSKMAAAFMITTIVYVIFVFLYTMIVLGILGFDGAACPIQLDMWRSIYNITFFQAYLLIVLGGYTGTLFACTLSMLVSAKIRSTVISAIIPFIVLCVLPFTSRIITLPQIFNLFPNQLMEVYISIKDFSLYEAGGYIMSDVMVIIPLYMILSVVLQPILYGVYKRVQIR